MPTGSSLARLRWPGMEQVGVVSAVAYDSFEPMPRWHRGMPSSWLTLIVTVGEPVLLHGRVPDRAESWPDTAASVLPTCLAGLHDQATAVRMQGRQRGVQLALDPLAAPRLLGLPAAELARACVDAEDVIGSAAAQLLERLADGRDLGHLTAAVQEVLTTAYRDAAPQGRPEVAHAWGEVQRAAGRIRVDRLAETVGFSTRQLRTLMRCERHRPGPGRHGYRRGLRGPRSSRHRVHGDGGVRAVGLAGRRGPKHPSGRPSQWSRLGAMSTSMVAGVLRPHIVTSSPYAVPTAEAVLDQQCALRLQPALGAPPERLAGWQVLAQGGPTGGGFRQVRRLRVGAWAGLVGG